MLSDVFKNILFTGCGADYKFEALEKALAANEAQAQAQAEVKEEKKEEVQEEEESSEDMSMGGMFD